MKTLQPNYSSPPAFRSHPRAKLRIAEHKTAKAKNKKIDLSKYQSPEGIVLFVKDVLHAEPAFYQEDILRAIVKYRRVSVRGPHGLGKTALASWFVLWLVLCHEDDVKVPTTASVWRQLTKFLWPEIKKWARKADFEKVGVDLRPGKELLELSIKLPGREAFAAASNDASSIEGAHAKVLGYVFDEAKAIPNSIFEGAEGAFSSAGDDTESIAYALAISTPGDPSGVFYDIHKRKPGYEDWWVRHVTLEECVRAGRISQQWADQRKRQWGENSAAYQNRVLGEFDASGEDNVIPLAWVEAANERWHELNGKGEGDSYYGADPARYGTDKTAIAHVVGVVLEEIIYKTKQDTMKTVGQIKQLVNRDKSVPIDIDVIGVGAGVFDKLNEDEYNVRAVNVAKSAKDKRGNPLHDVSGTREFANLRAFIWWMMRDALDPANEDLIAIPPDDMLIGDLTSPRYTYNSRGQIIVESKDDLRDRLGRSTDGADAFGLALYAKYIRRKPKEAQVYSKNPFYS